MDLFKTLEQKIEQFNQLSVSIDFCIGKRETKDDAITVPLSEDITEELMSAAIKTTSKKIIVIIN